MLLQHTIFTFLDIVKMCHYLYICYILYVYDTGPSSISMNTILISNITSISFVVQLDEVYDADHVNRINCELT